MHYRQLIGKRIKSWTVLDVADHGTNIKTKMRCQCDCGTIRSVDLYSLIHGISTSCGQCKRIFHEDNYERCVMNNGTSFIFDTEDEPIIRSYSWSMARGHVRTVINGKQVYLHQILMGFPIDQEVDHINGNKLDNRRSNLRLASHAQNNQNKGLRRDNTTGYKGVCFDKRSGSYIAYINANNQRTYLGYYVNKIDAAKAYDQAAVRLHGDFAKLNFPIKTHSCMMQCPERR